MNRTALIFLAAAAVGCGTKDDTATWDDTEADADTDADSDTDTDADTDVSYFEPVAVGFEYVGGVDFENEELLNYDYDDGNGERPYFVRLTFAETDFFGASSEDQLQYQCEAYAAFVYDTADLECQTYETKAAGDTFVTFTGTLEFAADNMSGENCTAFDPAEWTDGMPVDRFSGMQFGLGFGPVTDYLLGPYQDDAESLEIISKSSWASYVGMKHPASGAGGEPTFIGYDWTVALAFDWDIETGIVTSEEDGSLEFIEVENQTNAYVQSTAYWYEDFPNLDLDDLK